MLYCNLQDPKVIELTQELAKILGLKIRKAYVRGKVWSISSHLLLAVM